MIEGIVIDRLDRIRDDLMKLHVEFDCFSAEDNELLVEAANFCQTVQTRIKARLEEPVPA